MPPGEPAINPGPRAMMKIVFEEHCVHGQGVTVTVSVPNGKILAKKTLNHTPVSYTHLAHCKSV